MSEDCGKFMMEEQTTKNPRLGGSGKTNASRYVLEYISHV
jgi:hypothetical protein